uniref:Uncharacterized protein n=1 Tax=Aegilops tauschii subsp. strangulata TaxID=200361 RepID=A0A453Q4U5_AEGTS
RCWREWTSPSTWTSSMPCTTLWRQSTGSYGGRERARARGRGGGRSAGKGARRWTSSFRRVGE